MICRFVKEITTKTIEIMATLSLELQNRVKREIVNTQNYIDKEMKFSEDLRNHEIIDLYEKHLVKLNNMLL